VFEQGEMRRSPHNSQDRQLRTHSDFLVQQEKIRVKLHPESLYSSGFSDQSCMNRQYVKLLGESHRRKALLIRPLGQLLICSATFGED